MTEDQLPSKLRMTEMFKRLDILTQRVEGNCISVWVALRQAYLLGVQHGEQSKNFSHRPEIQS